VGAGADGGACFFFTLPLHIHAAAQAGFEAPFAAENARVGERDAPTMQETSSEPAEEGEL
jgi:hypothetical protein